MYHTSNILSTLYDSPKSQSNRRLIAIGPWGIMALNRDGHL